MPILSRALSLFVKVQRHANFKTVTNLDLQVNIGLNNKRHKDTDKSNAAIKGTQIRLKQNKAKRFKKWAEIKHLVQSKT